jgi:ankyrin repeat protein
MLLDAGADVNATSSVGSSPLVVATVRGHVPLALLLLEEGANANVDYTGYAALHWAVGTWETELTGPNGISAPSNHEWSAMAGLQRKAKLILVQALLDHAADPNARVEKAPPRVGYTASKACPIGATPFLLAAMAGEVEIMRLLLEAGASPLLAAKDRTTPLMAAAGIRRNLAESKVTEDRSLEASRLVLDLGADVNAVNDEGETALHGAAHIKSEVLVRLLADHGAHLDRENKQGHTPLFLAEHYLHPGSPPLPVKSTAADLLRRLLGQSSGVKKIAR